MLHIVAYRREPRHDCCRCSIDELVSDARKIHAILMTVEVGGNLIVDGDARMIRLNR